MHLKIPLQATPTDSEIVSHQLFLIYIFLDRQFIIFALCISHIISNSNLQNICESISVILLESIFHSYMCVHQVLTKVSMLVIS